MRILGIDPGSRITGFGIVNLLQSGKVAYVASGCVKVPAGPLPERLKVIHDGIQEVLRTWHPEAVAVEKVFMSTNADSALKLGQARASAMMAALNAGLPVAEYTALQIKQAVVGRGHADKAQVKHMVKALLALEGNPQADAADALACAICHAHQRQGSRALGFDAAVRARRARRGGRR